MSPKGKGGKSGSGGRDLTVRVKRGKGRSTSSRRWLERQLKDPYVQAAKRDGYRGRAAYKLIELDQKLNLLKPGLRLLDLGAAPGAWLQVAAKSLGPKGRLVGVDLLPIDPLPGVETIVGDATEPEVQRQAIAALGGPADLVLSDMAAAATGHGPTDHLKTMALAEAALDVAEEVLAPGGAFVAKVLQGGGERDFLERLKQGFASVRHVKPPASRKDSRELYVVAQGFRGAREASAERAM